jgi:hypothetical protein
VGSGWAAAGGAASIWQGVAQAITQPADPSSQRAEYSASPTVSGVLLSLALGAADFETGTLWVYGRRGSGAVTAAVNDDQGTSYGSVSLPAGSTAAWVSVAVAGVAVGAMLSLHFTVTASVTNSVVSRVNCAYVIGDALPEPSAATNADVQARPRLATSAAAGQAASAQVFAAHRSATRLQTGAIPLP